MSTYELIFIHNIPFLADSTGAIFYYSGHCAAKEQVHIGSYREGVLTLLDDWKARVEPNLDAWRASLEPSKRGTPLPRAEKPPRAVRGRAGKSAAAASSASSDTGPAVSRTGVEGIS
jgi:hypothetical protein